MSPTKFVLRSAGNPGRHALSPPARRDRQGPPRSTRPARLRSARRPQTAPGCRARGAFVLSNKAAQDAWALRADELRPRRIDGVSWSQILCRNGRCVRRGYERVATPKTAARTAAPAAQSRLPCPRLRGIARQKNIAPEQVSAHRPPFSVGLTTSAVRKMNPC